MDEDLAPPLPDPKGVVERIPVPGGTLDLHDSGLVVTRYPEGEVEAWPRLDQILVARDLGYGDDLHLLTREHEAAHHLLARALGLDRSPTLAALATGEPGKGRWSEEEAVLALQRYARRMGVDIVEILRG